jgi:hypothetical protein
MAVQQNKKSPSKRGMHRAHDSLSGVPLASSRRPARCICVTTSAPRVFIGARKSSRVRERVISLDWAGSFP